MHAQVERQARDRCSKIASLRADAGGLRGANVTVAAGVLLDSGGNYHGYIGDVARMAIQGDPELELEDLLAEIEAAEQMKSAPR